MRKSTSRREFVRNITFAGIAIGNAGNVSSLFKKPGSGNKKRIGIIGLDTSHSIEFTKTLNSADAGADMPGIKWLLLIQKEVRISNRVQKGFRAYTEEIKKYGVQIAASIKELLDNVDVVLLETNDGRLHLEQALLVFKAGKPVFIDKPLAGSLKDVIAIYEAAKQFNVPVFSSSSLRYIPDAEEIAKGKYGKVSGVDLHSPAHLEKTHPDLFWYGIHGVELLFTIMGTGCKTVTRVNSPDTMW